MENEELKIQVQELRAELAATHAQLDSLIRFTNDVRGKLGLLWDATWGTEDGEVPEGGMKPDCLAARVIDLEAWRSAAEGKE